MEDLQHAAVVTVRDCLGVQARETLLVVTDPRRAPLARTLAEAARRFAREVLTIEYRPRQLDGQEPPQPVPQVMAAVDVVLAITRRSIIHTAALRDATAAGARVATMHGITEDCLIRTMSADYRAIARRTRAVSLRLTNARVARVTTPAGTDLTVPIRGIEATALTGLLRDPGAWGSLPSGVAGVRPEAGQAEGVVLIDGSLPGICRIGEPVRLAIQGGVVVGIDGGKDARGLALWLEQAGSPRLTLTALGVGTNDRATVSGDVLEDITTLGTVHLVFSADVSPGGELTTPIQVVGVLLGPTLTLDGVDLLEHGRTLIE